MNRNLASYLKDRRALFGKEFPGPFGATDRKKWESAVGFLMRTLSDIERDNVKGKYDENKGGKKSGEKQGKASKKGK